MKQEALHDALNTVEMRAEYDFSGGVRNKYAKELNEQGYAIRIYQADGTFTERVVLGAKTVVLEPDVWEYFSDSEAVNRVLRAIISAMPAGLVKSP